MNLAFLLLLAVLALAGYGAFRLTQDARQVFSERKLQRKQEEDDEVAFWEYEGRHAAIRAKFDPKSEWNEATSVPDEYTREIRSLNLQYRETLQRRNGWTAKDFEDSSA